MRAQTILWLLLRSRKADLLFGVGEPRDYHAGETGSREGSWKRRPSTPSNYLTIRDRVYKQLSQFGRVVKDYVNLFHVLSHCEASRSGCQDYVSALQSTAFDHQINSG